MIFFELDIVHCMAHLALRQSDGWSQTKSCFQVGSLVCVCVSMQQGKVPCSADRIKMKRTGEVRACRTLAEE